MSCAKTTWTWRLLVKDVVSDHGRRPRAKKKVEAVCRVEKGLPTDMGRRRAFAAGVLEPDRKRHSSSPPVSGCRAVSAKLAGHGRAERLADAGGMVLLGRAAHRPFEAARRRHRYRTFRNRTHCASFDCVLSGGSTGTARRRRHRASACRSFKRLVDGPRLAACASSQSAARYRGSGDRFR